MKKRNNLICFVVEINGEKICTAGIDSEYGIVTAILDWVRRDLKNFSEESRNTVLEEELNFNVSAAITHGKNDIENLRWINCSLAPGDEICIKIIESDQVDEPQSKERRDPDLVDKAKREYYEKLKREYET